MVLEQDGLSSADVSALCDVGASTKQHAKSPSGAIGHKGVGFKSVFLLTDAPVVGSFARGAAQQEAATEAVPLIC